MICGVKIMKITEYWSTNSGLAGKSDAVTAKDTIVGANSQFTGNIMFTQTLKISGTVKGNIESNDDSDAQVTVESNGVVALNGNGLEYWLYRIYFNFLG